MLVRFSWLVHIAFAFHQRIIISWKRFCVGRAPHSWPYSHSLKAIPNLPMEESAPHSKLADLKLQTIHTWIDHNMIAFRWVREGGRWVDESFLLCESIAWNFRKSVSESLSDWIYYGLLVPQPVRSPFLWYTVSRSCFALFSSAAFTSVLLVRSVLR